MPVTIQGQLRDYPCKASVLINVFAPQNVFLSIRARRIAGFLGNSIPPKPQPQLGESGEDGSLVLRIAPIMCRRNRAAASSRLVGILVSRWRDPCFRSLSGPSVPVINLGNWVVVVRGGLVRFHHHHHWYREGTFDLLSLLLGNNKERHSPGFAPRKRGDLVTTTPEHLDRDSPSGNLGSFGRATRRDETGWRSASYPRRPCAAVVAPPPPPPQPTAQC